MLATIFRATDLDGFPNADRVLPAAHPAWQTGRS